MRHFTKAQYEAYLISPQWHQKRQERLAFDGSRCRGCGRLHTPEQPLDCHHINYYHFGEENIMTDLVSLCRKCHKLTHRVLCRPTGYNPDGSKRLGWKDTLPEFITEDLEARGLM